jgi:hypothetical protein
VLINLTKERFMRWHPLLILVVAGLAAFAAGCGDDDDNGVGPAVGTVRISMTDAPADIDEVNIVVREISVHRTGSNDSQGWYTVRADSDTTISLLTLTNGKFVTLGSELVPSGGYDQVRLILGEGSTVVVDGVEHPLVVPSGMQSGIKVQGPFTVPSGGTIDLALDFDAARSIHETGSGTWMLRPVIRLVALTQSGSIAGRIDPVVGATIYAMLGSDTLSSALPISDGRFKMVALPTGTYTVKVDADSGNGYRDTTLTGVTVAPGDTTQLGTISLTPASMPPQ